MSGFPCTAAVRAAIATDEAYGAVVPPIVTSSTFTFRAIGDKRPYDYSRSGNPTRDQLADALAELEGGHGAVVTASGMAAITLVLQLVPPGGRVVAPHDGYGGTWRLLCALADRGAFSVDLVDLTDPVARDRALGSPADLVWVETPSNPLLRITDIEAVVAAAGDARVVVDNTFLSPMLQRPLELGADAVVHSTTKYLNGHSDVVGGAVVAKDASLLEDLADWANCLGITGSPHDAWMTLRGMRTLGVRMERHLENARAVVEGLVGHPGVAKVHWPGLPDHPGHAIAARQQSGFGAIVSVELACGLSAVCAAAERVRCFSLAESLGGVESLICHPATMTHASMSAEARRIAGITDGLVRLSVGIEDPGDLVQDLQQAFRP